MDDEHPFRPSNAPAIGDLMSLFDFCKGECAGHGERYEGHDD
jgi:hypothetical protein